MERHSPCSYRAHGLRETDINVYICEFLIAVITNQQKTEAWGKKKTAYFSPFCSAEVQLARLLSQLLVSQGQIQGIGHLGSYWETLGRISFQAR